MATCNIFNNRLSIATTIVTDWTIIIHFNFVLNNRGLNFNLFKALNGIFLLRTILDINIL